MLNKVLHCGVGFGEDLRKQFTCARDMVDLTTDLSREQGKFLQLSRC